MPTILTTRCHRVGHQRWLGCKELTQKFEVIMLERGRDIVHIKDYVNANKEAGIIASRTRTRR